MRILLKSLGWMAMCAFFMASQTDASPGASQTNFAAARERMVKSQIEARNVREASVLGALKRVPRHLFVGDDIQRLAYTDSPLPIGYRQTISQPYIVAFMTEAAKLKHSDRVLEVGTGSGYQTAVLAEIVRDVYSLEIVEPLAKKAAEVLTQLQYKNVHARIGDGYAGWPEAAPFDVIFVTAAPDHIPQPLIDQLKEGGRFIIPVGGTAGKERQHLVRVTKTKSGLIEESLLPVSFVPMTGIASAKSHGK